MANWYVEQLVKEVVGGKIVGIAEGEDGDFGLIIKPPALIEHHINTRIPPKTIYRPKIVMWILQDDEGNGPGRFSIEPFKS